jgi:hypothetical protein
MSMTVTANAWLIEINIKVTGNMIALVYRHSLALENYL